jgi:mannosyltransferase OCH1-like enzyme
MIPRTIHQVWLGYTSPQPPPEFAAAASTWTSMNPDWEYRRWTAAEIDDLFASARPDLLEYYRHLPYWVQKADAARYLILHEHGGVYADLDIICLRSFDAFNDADAVLAPTEPLGFSNDLMMASAGHPLFATLIDELPASFRRWHRAWIPRHFRVMCSAGSLYLTRNFVRFPNKRGVRLLTDGEYGHGDPRHAFVGHIEGNSWAGWDTRALLFLARHWKTILIAAVLVVLASLVRR